MLFGGIAIVLAMAALEGLLALTGMQPERFESDPYVGFASNAPLFTPRSTPDGGTVLATASNRLEFFNPQQFSMPKPKGVFRIFTLGGSTTYGHPYFDATSFSGWLREYLGALEPDRRWEVINVGGISYGSYRVARLMEELAGYEPDLFLVYSGHNEFLERRIYGKVQRSHTPLRIVAHAVAHLRTATLVKRGLEALVKKRQTDTASTTVLELDPVTELEKTLGPSSYKRSELHREETLEHYRFNIGRMCDIAKSARARILFVTPAGNLREASPFKSEHREGLDEAQRQRWRTLYDQARRDYAGPNPAEALKPLAEAEAIDALPANLHYVKARVLEKLGRYVEAKAAYERARDEDVCPLRATAGVRSMLDQAVAERRAPLVDFTAFVEARSEHGIPGASLFLDHVHPTLEGYRLLGLEILKRMEREGWARPAWNEAAIDEVKQRVLSRVTPATHGLALMNLCKVLGWAGKREEAYRAATRAVELAPNIARIRYEAGLAALLSSRTNDAAAHYREALRLDPRHANAHGSLGVILEDQGQLAEALEHYRRALEFGAPRDQERNRRNLEHATQALGASK